MTEYLGTWRAVFDWGEVSFYDTYPSHREEQENATITHVFWEG